MHGETLKLLTFCLVRLLAGCLSIFLASFKVSCGVNQRCRNMWLYNGL